jgi:DNA repair exonuclease SbcCD ATPase subunit
MANVEEILFKMGIRTDGLKQGLQQAKAEVTNLGEHLEKKLSAKPGEGLKNLFSELTSMSPMLGAAITAAFNPITGGFQLATQVFTAAKAKLQEFNAALDQEGEDAAQPVGKMRELLLVGRDKASANRQERQWWENDLLNGKPGEVEQERIRKRIEEARVASGGDPLKFSQAKLAILDEEKSAAEAQKLDALERQRKLAQAGEDPERIATTENIAARIQSQLKEEEKLAKKIDQQEAIVKELTRLRDAPLSTALESFTKNNPMKGTEFDPFVGVAATGIGGSITDIFSGSEDERGEWVKSAQEKLDSLMQQKQNTRLERTELEKKNQTEKELLRENLHNIQETKAEADAAKQRSLELDKAIDAERKALFEAERKRREEDTKNAIAQAEKRAGADKVAFLAEKIAIEEKALKKAQDLTEGGRGKAAKEEREVTDELEYRQQVLADLESQQEAGDDDSALAEQIREEQKAIEDLASRRRNLFAQSLTTDQMAEERAMLEADISEGEGILREFDRIRQGTSGGLDITAEKMVADIKRKIDSLRADQKAIDTAIRQTPQTDEEEARRLKAQLEIDREALATETLNKQKAQEKLDRDLAYTQQKRDEHTNAPYLTTVDELAKMPGWGGQFGGMRGLKSGFKNFQRAAEDQIFAMGGGYANQFADQAREALEAEGDAKRAFMMYGPNSSQYKQARERAQSLQKGLGESGLVKSDVSLAKIDKNIADLLEAARKEGLIVKPNMGK